MMEEIYSNNKGYKSSSIKSSSSCITKKIVHFTPMQQSVMNSTFMLNEENQSSEDGQFYSQGVKKPNKTLNLKKPHSMLDLSKQLLDDDSQSNNNENDVYDDLIRLLSNKIKGYNTRTTQLHRKKGNMQLRKGSNSSGNLIQIKEDVQNNIIIDSSALTNTELISDFYEYTNTCMGMILQIKTMKELGTAVELGIDRSSKKRVAVFDLDETLVHCVDTSTEKKSQHRLTVNLPLK